jgi:hypothetical protein
LAAKETPSRAVTKVNPEEVIPLEEGEFKDF